MKTLKDFWNRRVLGKTPPAPRGHVDLHNAPGAVIARAKEAKAKEANRARMKEAKKKANAENRPGMFVYRAKTDTWEDFKDVCVKERPPVDDEASPPDEAQGT